MDLFSMVGLAVLMVIAICDRIVGIYFQIKERRDSDVYFDGSRKGESEQSDAGK
ncbi:hypothetical protein [Paraburkholderia flava]|uniref:hypothetical protein n=1 Tax=Paraburkholderia flava TaxID=2547393 RepID=UPI001414E3B7|nr:hypothetical protein [Paraburkholderia flava]